MKVLKLSTLSFVLFSMLLFSGCGDDEPEEVTPSFTGNYVIKHAAVAKTFYLYTSTGDSLPAMVGTDITAAIQTALLGAVECSSPEKTYVELREDHTIYMSCELQNQLHAGTWDEISATELILNLNNSAIPSSPTGFVLTVSDIEVTATGLTGVTSVPLPKEMFAAGLAQYGLTLAETPAVYLVSFALEFEKK
jgi:hypothetical protein